MSNFPKRVPGASVNKAVEPPGGGWFGQGVEWPTEDEDLIKVQKSRQVMAQYLDGSDLADGGGAIEMLDRVLDGIKRLGSDQ